MDKFIKQPQVPSEYPFSLTTINRWRRDGTLTTFRQGKKRVLLLRAELDALVSSKEKVAVGSSDEEAGNVGNKVSRCKGTKSSSMKLNISTKKDEDNENTVSAREDS